MRILDYMFYRIYVYARKNNEAPTATAALGIAGFLIAAFPILWLEIPYLLFGWMPENTKVDRKIAAVIVSCIIYFCVYFWYKSRDKEIVKRYEHSKYNEKIPYFVIPLFVLVIAITSMFIEIPIHIWIEDNHYDGIVLKWFLRLFE
ncbi:MAG: hypothetical protein K6A78_07490 [Prevotella sp.]|nr:hypothetical protein [Prevotella sp.]